MEQHHTGNGSACNNSVGCTGHSNTDNADDGRRAYARQRNAHNADFTCPSVLSVPPVLPSI